MRENLRCQQWNTSNFQRREWEVVDVWAQLVFCSCCRHTPWMVTFFQAINSKGNLVKVGHWRWEMARIITVMVIFEYIHFQDCGLQIFFNTPTLVGIKKNVYVGLVRYVGLIIINWLINNLWMFTIFFFFFLILLLQLLISYSLQGQKLLNTVTSDLAHSFSLHALFRDADRSFVLRLICLFVDLISEYFNQSFVGLGSKFG